LPDVDGTMAVVSQVNSLEVAKLNKSDNIVLGASVVASGTAIDFVGIPAGVKRITVMFDGVSTNGTSNPLIQLGSSGGVEIAGYVSTGTRLDETGSGKTSLSSGIVVSSILAANAISLNALFCLVSGNSWVCGYSGCTASQTFSGGGSKALSNTLDRIRITTVNGTDLFDAGTINISWEY